MAYTFEPLDSPNGVDTRQVDCTGILKPLELVSSATATSQDTTVVTISTAAAANTTVLTKDDGVSTIAIGKGVTLGVSAARETIQNVDIELQVVGDGSPATNKTVTIIQPVVKTITS